MEQWVVSCNTRLLPYPINHCFLVAVQNVVPPFSICRMLPLRIYVLIVRLSVVSQSEYASNNCHWTYSNFTANKQQSINLFYMQASNFGTAEFGCLNNLHFVFTEESFMAFSTIESPVYVSYDEYFHKLSELII